MAYRKCENQAAAKAALEVGQKVCFKDISIKAQNLDYGTIVAKGNNTIDIHFVPGETPAEEETICYDFNDIEIYEEVSEP